MRCSKKPMADLRENSARRMYETHVSELKTKAEIRNAIKHAQECFGAFDALVTSSSRGTLVQLKRLRNHKPEASSIKTSSIRCASSGSYSLFELQIQERSCASVQRRAVALPMSGAYCATQHALEEICDTLRLELSIFGIDVVLIEPGFVRESFAGRTAAEQRTRRLSHQPKMTPISTWANYLVLSNFPNVPQVRQRCNTRSAGADGSEAKPLRHQSKRCGSFMGEESTARPICRQSYSKAMGLKALD